jgi:hypothetical protein
MAVVPRERSTMDDKKPETTAKRPAPVKIGDKIKKYEAYDRLQG